MKGRFITALLTGFAFLGLSANSSIVTSKDIKDMIGRNDFASAEKNLVVLADKTKKARLASDIRKKKKRLIKRSKRQERAIKKQKKALDRKKALLKRKQDRLKKQREMTQKRKKMLKDRPQNRRTQKALANDSHLKPKKTYVARARVKTSKADDYLKMKSKVRVNVDKKSMKKARKHADDLKKSPAARKYAKKYRKYATQAK